MLVSDWLTWYNYHNNTNSDSNLESKFSQNSIYLIISLKFFSIIAASYTPYVTYGSVFKLINDDYNVRLHSHDVKYGTGSGQQSITGTEMKEDINSHWVVLNVTNEPYQRG